jgi:Flp pilus assembly pilin Flp
VDNQHIPSTEADQGATMVEYVLLVVGIAIAAMLAVAALGDRLSALFDTFVA